MFLAGALIFPAQGEDQPSPALELARQLNQAFVEVAENISPAVVVITTTQKRAASHPDLGGVPFWQLIPEELRRQFEEEFRRRFEGGQLPPGHPPVTGRGSGIVVSEDGYILTNFHVVEDAEKIEVRFKDGRNIQAVIRGVDPQSDLAVLKIKAEGLMFAKLGDSAASRVGEFVIAIGAPFDLNYSVTVGHISGKGRSILASGFSAERYRDQDFIQTDASINPGNSGGPLVNLYGEVIGINSMIRGMNTGIGFAIPSNLAKVVMERLISEGKFVRSYIGVRIEDVRFADDRGVLPAIDEGVLIREITPDSPASKSDLKPADIVLGVNGKEIKTPRQLQESISILKPGEEAVLDVARLGPDGNIKNLKVKVMTEALPESQQASSRPVAPDTEVAFGATIKPLNRELASQFKTKVNEGLIVTAVENGSLAQRRGLQPGDLIIEVNRKPVSTLEEFREALEAADPKGKGILLYLVSRGGSRFVVLKESGD
jgi:serine protease Do